MNRNIRAGLLPVVALIAAGGLSGCYMLNAEHYEDVRNIRSNIERLKAADDRLAARIAALKPVEQALKREFADEISTRQAGIRHPSAASVGMAMQNPLLFASGSAEVSRDGRKLLTRLAGALKAAPKQAVIRIVGHTDPVALNRALKAGYIDNWGLSAARAAAVARRLIWNSGIAPERIRIEGRAQYDPVVANDTPALMARNRRVEVLVEMPE
jgi:chemotaxis protein MotB